MLNNNRTRDDRNNSHQQRNSTEQIEEVDRPSLSRELTGSMLKRVQFGTAVLSSTIRVADKKGLPNAPKVDVGVVSLSEAAEKFKHETLLLNAKKKHKTDIEIEESPDEGFYGSSTEEEYITDAPKQVSFKIVSLNAGLLCYDIWGVTVYQNPPFANQRLQILPDALIGTMADVIAIQEVYEAKHAKFIIEAMRDEYPYIARRKSGGMMALHNGLITLSKYPIKHIKFTPFNDVTWIEKAFGSKGYLEVKVDIPAVGAVCFFNVHLASGAVDPESSPCTEVRNFEIEQLLEAARLSSHSGEIPIIIGDMNTAPNLCKDNYELFLKNGWYDSYVAAKRNGEYKRTRTTDSTAIISLVNQTVAYNESENFTNYVCNDEVMQDVARSRSKSCGVELVRSFKNDYSHSAPPAVIRKEYKRVNSYFSSTESIDEFIIDMPDEDIDYCKDFTWDPNNPLNLIGPHSNCHGQRCDHVFLPLWLENCKQLKPIHAEILFKEPLVMIEYSCTCIAKGGNLITISDHYGIFIEFQIGSNK